MSDALEILRDVRGRALLASPDGTLFLGRSYDIFASRDEGRSWLPVTSIPRSWKRKLAEPLRLTRRLLRQEVRALVRLTDGRLVASNREGVYFALEGQARMTRAHVPAGARAVAPPMRLAVGPDDTIVWGEYASSREAREVRLFASDDLGESFDVVHVFPKGFIRHVHNIRYDAEREHYWVLTGDYGENPGIGRLARDFSSFEWLVHGEQRFRAVEVFDEGDTLLYATDTEIEANRFVRVHKETGESEEFGRLDGSCIHGCRFGTLRAVSSSVEPSAVNPSQWATLLVSRDGTSWREVYRARKDRWSARYFQYGSIILPTGTTADDLIVFSGQALRGLDQRTIIARLREGAQ